MKDRVHTIIAKEIFVTLNLLQFVCCIFVSYLGAFYGKRNTIFVNFVFVHSQYGYTASADVGGLWGLLTRFGARKKNIHIVTLYLWLLPMIEMKAI